MDKEITIPDAKEIQRKILVYIDKYGSDPVYSLPVTLIAAMVADGDLPTEKDQTDPNLIALRNIFRFELIKFRQNEFILEFVSDEPLTYPPAGSGALAIYLSEKRYALTDTGRVYLAGLNISDEGHTL